MGARGHTVVSAPKITINRVNRYDVALLRAERWTGGKKLDTAILEYRVRPTDDIIGRHFLGQALHQETSKPQIVRIEVDSRYATRGGEGTAASTVSGPRVIHVGVISAVQPRYGREGPTYELISTLRPCHFGAPLAGYPSLSGRQRHKDLTNYDGKLPTPEFPELLHVGQEVVPRDELPLGNVHVTFIQEDIVFNPVVNGLIVGNQYPQPTSGVQPLTFLDPDQTRTLGNRDAYGLPHEAPERPMDRSVALAWTLESAVVFILQWLNAGGQEGPDPTVPSVSLVANPRSRSDMTVGGRTQLKDIIPKNLKLPLGTYLPEALDRLLQPYGFDWLTDLSNPAGPTIKFFHRGTGQAIGVHHQPPGSVLQPGPLHAEGFQLNYDTAGTINAVRVLGAPRLYEITVNLIPAWDYKVEKAIDPGADWNKKLLKGSPEWNADPALHNVARRWVMNEGGSCIGNTVRGEGSKTKKIKDAFDLPKFMGVGPGVFSVRNRRFLPMITCNDDLTPMGPHGGVLIEISRDSGATWRSLSDYGDIGSVTVLADECGISFDDPWPPFGPMVRRGLVRLRVTASIQADDRLEYDGHFGASVAGSPQAEVIDASDKFFFRRVTPRSQFYGQVRLLSLKSTEIDDEDKLKLFWESLKTWNQADCDGRIALPTLACPAELGQTVPRIGGINLDLGTTVSAGAMDSPSDLISPLRTSGAPTIVGIGYDQNGQESSLFLNSYKGKVSL